MANNRRDSGSDAVHVIPTNDPPPEIRFPNPGDSSVWATEDDYSRVWADTESPSKKTRGSPSSSSASEIRKSFFKTKLCCKFSAGTCPYDGGSCHFAHSVEELRLPFNRQCKKLGCPYGESCTFVHDDDVSRNRESFVMSLGGGGGGARDSQIVKPPNWKTRICNKWETTGNCPFGPNCHFAHGASELHKFGGGLVKEECKIGMSSAQNTKQTGQADNVSSLVPPGVPPQRTSSAVTQKPNAVRTQRKWKGPDKISRIYGDWIDDIE